MVVIYFSGQSVLPQAIMQIDFLKFADSYYNIDDISKELAYHYVKQ